MRRLAILIAVVAMVLGFLKPSHAITLWYNGDFDGSNGLANEINTTISSAMTYDDFIVPSGGWTINSIWSNNLMDFTGVSQAYWEIRSGVSNGNGGTLISSGTNSATQTATGRSDFGYTEYGIDVAGLNLALGPGTYWLSVAPIGFQYGRSFVSTTSGSNAIGTPPGNNDNSFFDSPYWGYNFYPARLVLSLDTADFSMGVAGVGGGPVIPEPATMSLLGIGLLGLAGLRKKKKS